MTELLISQRQTGSFVETPETHPEAHGQYDEWLDAAYNAAIHSRSRIMTKQLMGRFWAPEGYAPTSDQDPLGDLEYLFGLQQEAEEQGDAIKAAKLARLAAGELQLRFAAQIDFMTEDWEMGLMPRWDIIELGGRQYVIYDHAPRFRFTGRIEAMAGNIIEDTKQSTPGFAPIIDMSPRIDLATGDFVPYQPGADVVVLPHPAAEHAMPPWVMERHMSALAACMHPALLTPDRTSMV